MVDHIECGEVLEGRSVDAFLEGENPNAETLVIVFSADCRCVRLAQDPLSVLPGSRFKVPLTWDPRWQKPAGTTPGTFIGAASDQVTAETTVVVQVRGPGATEYPVRLTASKRMPYLENPLRDLWVYEDEAEKVSGSGMIEWVRGVEDPLIVQAPDFLTCELHELELPDSASLHSELRYQIDPARSFMSDPKDAVIVSYRTRGESVRHQAALPVEVGKRPRFRAFPPGIAVDAFQAARHEIEITTLDGGAAHVLDVGELPKNWTAEIDDHRVIVRQPEIDLASISDPPSSIRLKLVSDQNSERIRHFDLPIAWPVSSTPDSDPD